MTFDYYKEAVQVAFEDIGVVLDLTPEQWDQVGESVATWAENEALMHVPRVVPQDQEESETILALREEIARLKRNEEVFVESVKQRRNAREVWIANGSVVYR